jgi:hypothetical protein
VWERAVDGGSWAFRKSMGIGAREMAQPRAWEWLSRMVEWEM